MTLCFFFLSKTHLAGLWQIRQVHLLESKGYRNSDAHYFRLFGKLEKKEVKMPSDQVSSQLNVRQQNNTKFQFT